MASETGKLAVVMFENVLDSYEHQDMLLPLTDFDTPDPAKMQNSNNVIWYPVQQHAPIIDGFDLTGLETGTIEETFPVVLGDPSNDFVEQRADDLRDKQFWERRGKQSGLRQATELNKRIAQQVAQDGSLYFRFDTSSSLSGYDFVAEGQAILNERQTYSMMGRTFILNDRDTLTFAKDLAARQTLQGRPADTWNTGQIGQNVAEFDMYTGSFLPNLVGGADPATTTTADVSGVPQGGTVVNNTVVTNVDYRIQDIPVVASGSYNVGDKIKFANGGTDVQSVGLADKNPSGQAMTFTIVAKPDATTISVFPKPIAPDDPSLTILQKAYSNIDTQILSGATVNRLNIDDSVKTNLFWANDAIKVTGGTIPAELFPEFDGMKMIQSTMSNGQTMYMIYDGDIAKLTFRFRIFTWYGITVCNPSACGVATTF